MTREVMRGGANVSPIMICITLDAQVNYRCQSEGLTHFTRGIQEQSILEVQPGVHKNPNN